MDLNFLPPFDVIGLPKSVTSLGEEGGVSLFPHRRVDACGVGLSGVQLGREVSLNTLGEIVGRVSGGLVPAV